jgi:alpha-galactosidase
MVLNRNPTSRPAEFDWKAEDVHDELSKRSAAFGETNYRLRNLWNGRFVGNTARPLSMDVPGHDVLVLRLTHAGGGK